MAKSAPEYESCNRESLSRAWLELSLISHLNSVLVGERSWGNLCRGVSWSVVERSSVRTVVGAVGRTYGAKLRGSQGETETSEE